MGALASRMAFGHNGCYVSLADPERQKVMAYLTGRLRALAADRG